MRVVLECGHKRQKAGKAFRAGRIVKTGVLSGN